MDGGWDTYKITRIAMVPRYGGVMKFDRETI